MSDLEKLARVINAASPRPAHIDVAMHQARSALEHLRENVGAEMVEAMDAAPADYRAEFQAAIDAILNEPRQPAA